MRALIFDKSKQSWEDSRGFDLANIPKPKIQNPDDPSRRSESEADVIIKVHYAGVCGSDKGIWYRTAFRDQILNSIDAENERPLSSAAGGALSPPAVAKALAGRRQERVVRKKSFRIIGHEFFGEIIELGADAQKKFKLKKGDFVSCESHVVDNKCYQCLRGEKNVCTNEKILGISHDGGFAEYARVPAHIVWKTDTSKIRPEIAAVQEPFGNAVHAASKVDLKGKSVAIFGLGPIGLFLLLVIKGMGAKEIIGVEPNPISQEMAKKLGIDYVIPLKKFEIRNSKFEKGEQQNRHNPEVIEEIMKITNNIGVDVAFEMAGFNDSFNNALFATRRGGQVILFGIKTGDFVLEDYNRLIVRGLTLHAVIGRQIWKTWETTKKLLEDPKNKIQEQIYKIILNEGRGTILPISEYTKERFEKMMSEHPKILIQF